MPRALNIGSFRDRVTFQDRTYTSDGMGGNIPSSYSDVFSCWADVKELRGDRESRFAQINYNTLFEVKVRYRNGDTNEPSVNYRLVWNGRNLTIHSILERNESFIKIIAYSTEK